MSEEVQADEVVEEVAAEVTEAVAEEVEEVVETAAPAVVAPAAKVATPAATVEAVEDDDTRANRKVREGIVVSDKMDSTAVVAIIERVRHPKYAKFVNRTKRLYAHDVSEERARIGDKVRIMETRPLSKLKHWRVVEILERAK
jgi:small subunit ribosomal protein S17